MSNHALTISRLNCEQLIGLRWPHTKRFAAANNVPLWRVGKKTLIPAAPLLAALERAAAASAPPVDELELACRRMGLERV